MHFFFALFLLALSIPSSLFDMSAHPPPPPVDPSTLDGGINAYKGDSVIACSVVFIILCTIFLVLRFVAHRISRSKISWEDWIMIPAWVLMMGLCANVIFSKSRFSPTDN